MADREHMHLLAHFINAKDDSVDAAPFAIKDLPQFKPKLLGLGRNMTARGQRTQGLDRTLDP